MTKQQIRGYYESQVRWREHRLKSLRQIALQRRNKQHPEQRQEIHFLYHQAKNALTYAREQLLRCQPTKKG